MIRVELRTLFLRPRVWVSVLLLCGLPAVVAVFLATTHLTPPPGQGAAFLSAVENDGALFPAAALALVLPIFLPIAVAMFAGDSVAGEAANGTLRYLLIRPVARTRLLMAKLLGIAVFIIVVIVLVVVTSFLVGGGLFGFGEAAAVGQPGGVTSLSGVTLTPVELVARLLAAIGYIVLCMIGVGVIALFLSTVSDSGLGAALGTLAILITSEVLTTLDAAAIVKPYLPSNYWLSWIDFFRVPIFWGNIDKGMLVQGAYILVFFGAAWANLTSKDITS
ncbi:MAG TPA: ABC transporter permease subunit [Pseudonocardiaceae bacterium]|nr:ABC transporter permease subunit [Pseudonocardiaceae bacterium]